MLPWQLLLHMQIMAELQQEEMQDNMALGRVHQELHDTQVRESLRTGPLVGGLNTFVTSHFLAQPAEGPGIHHTLEVAISPTETPSCA